MPVFVRKAMGVTAGYPIRVREVRDARMTNFVCVGRWRHDAYRIYDRRIDGARKPRGLYGVRVTVLCSARFACLFLRGGRLRSSRRGLHFSRCCAALGSSGNRFFRRLLTCLFRSITGLHAAYYTIAKQFCQYMFRNTSLMFIGSKMRFWPVSGLPVAYNLEEVTLVRSKQLAVSRLLALLCVCMLLVAFFAAPLHKHDSGEQGTCFLCHATERADVVPIANDVSKPISASSNLIPACLKPVPVLEVTHSTRTPRAPPSTLLS
jgi:hypothetical protein